MHESAHVAQLVDCTVHHCSTVHPLHSTTVSQSITLQITIASPCITMHPTIASPCITMHNALRPPQHTAAPPRVDGVTPREAQMHRNRITLMHAMPLLWCEMCTLYDALRNDTKKQCASQQNCCMLLLCCHCCDTLSLSLFSVIPIFQKNTTPLKYFLTCKTS